MEKTLATWESVEIFHSGDDFFSALIADVRRAKFSIQIEVYIFNIDSFTRPLLTELAQAQQRGVTVQILVDGFGSFQSLNQ
ncbi:MAG TPA: phospholipase D-like domain-containing protein, partial [Pseudobdellovibrionaceae bacterium]|nr:phospholipase D-like domain-containing protein [Pseudobdellovibrionaceae bacterium]